MKYIYNKHKKYVKLKIKMSDATNCLLKKSIKYDFIYTY